jgi:hypothetical protein
MTAALCYLGGATAAVRGMAHLVPTPKVVAGFGAISDDNRNIITMEWIAEGAMLIFIGTLVILATAVDHTAPVARAAYILAAAGLTGLAVVSLFTGFKVKFLPFKLCPAIFAASAALILAGGFA